MLIFPLLNTERLKLRKIKAEDIPSLIKYANNKKIAEKILNMPYPYSEPQAVFRLSYVSQGFKNRSRFVFSIELKETQEFIGEISLHLEIQNNKAQIGYWVGEPFWNRGIASEAVKAVLEFGFETLNLEKIYGTCAVKNIASGKVMENNGMKNINTNGAVGLYEIKKEEYTA